MNKAEQIAGMILLIESLPQGISLTDMAQALYAAGLRFVPELKVLSELEIVAIIQKVWGAKNACRSVAELEPSDTAIAQAQYDAIVKPIWGEDA